MSQEDVCSPLDKTEPHKLIVPAPIFPHDIGEERGNVGATLFALHAKKSGLPEKSTQRHLSAANDA